MTDVLVVGGVGSEEVLCWWLSQAASESKEQYKTYAFIKLEPYLSKYGTPRTSWSNRGVLTT